MKEKLVIILLFCCCWGCALAHNVNYINQRLRHWVVAGAERKIDGSLLMVKDDLVYLQLPDNSVVSFPVAIFSAADQEYAIARYREIIEINRQSTAVRPSVREAVYGYKNGWLWLIGLAIVVSYIIIFSISSGAGVQIANRAKFRYLYPVLAVGCISVVSAFTTKSYKISSTTNPLFIDSAFGPYKATVTTHWDGTYFYVESYGIPAHQMMTGITNWQQQVPIPQCYTGSNTWSIPLNPVMSATPTPTAAHFFRGAIAIAANGVPIFNALTNTGVDAFLTGQLDNFGGHCGMADDYHYHTAPLHLSATSGTMPIAFALDGFAVYGTLEPDGSPMAALDANHGHTGASGVYHYHGTSNYPYMIGNMVGQVTEDGTSQIIPQAAAHPVRPGQTPLPGAVITGCKQMGTNGYKLFYSLGGQVDTVRYSWTPAGVYNFNFISPVSGSSAATYNGFTPCYVLPTGIVPTQSTTAGINLFPNPATDELNISLGDNLNANDITEFTVYNMAGQLILNSMYFQPKIDVHAWPKGAYILKLKLARNEVARQFTIY